MKLKLLPCGCRSELSTACCFACTGRDAVTPRLSRSCSSWIGGDFGGYEFMLGAFIYCLAFLCQPSLCGEHTSGTQPCILCGKHIFTLQCRIVEDLLEPKVLIQIYVADRCVKTGGNFKWCSSIKEDYTLCFGWFWKMITGMRNNAK